jgi:hypothetical protein
MVTTGPGPNNAPATPATRGDGAGRASRRARGSGTPLRTRHGQRLGRSRAAACSACLRLPPDSDDERAPCTPATSEWAQRSALAAAAYRASACPCRTSSARPGLRACASSATRAPWCRVRPSPSSSVDDYAPWWPGRRRDASWICAAGAVASASRRRFTPAAALMLLGHRCGCPGPGAGEPRAARPRGRVRVVQSDLFEAPCGRTFDIMLCNPPYVDARISPPCRGVRAEPPRGLGAGDDGLDLALQILARAPRTSAAGACCFSSWAIPGRRWMRCVRACP